MTGVFGRVVGFLKMVHMRGFGQGIWKEDRLKIFEDNQVQKNDVLSILCCFLLLCLIFLKQPPKLSLKV